MAISDALRARSGVDAFAFPAALRSRSLGLVTCSRIVVAAQEGIVLLAPSIGLFACEVPRPRLGDAHIAWHTWRASTRRG